VAALILNGVVATLHPEQSPDFISASLSRRLTTSRLNKSWMRLEVEGNFLVVGSLV
jgi:hypothetical protein